MDVVITGGPMSEWKQGSEVTFDLTESNAHFKYEQVVPSSVINGLGVTVGISGKLKHFSIQRVVINASAVVSEVRS